MQKVKNAEDLPSIVSVKLIQPVAIAPTTSLAGWLSAKQHNLRFEWTTLGILAHSSAESKFIPFSNITEATVSEAQAPAKSAKAKSE